MDFFTFVNVDQYRRPVKKTKKDYPYTYDPFVIWQSKDYHKKIDKLDTVYTDRIFYHDCNLHDELCKKHFGNTSQIWANRDKDKIELFLRDFFNAPKLELFLVMEYCNVSSGYPLWRFDYMQQLPIG